jgi:hypothetical protein
LEVARIKIVYSRIQVTEERFIQVERKGRVRQYNSTGFIGYRSIQVAGNSTIQVSRKKSLQQDTG